MYFSNLTLKLDEPSQTYNSDFSIVHMGFSSVIVQDAFRVNGEFLHQPHRQ
jgi:hypothetical protein